MGVGLGVLLVVVGAITFWAVELDIPRLNEEALGITLMIAGVVAVVLALIVNAQRTRTKTAGARRHGGPPPA